MSDTGNGTTRPTAGTGPLAGLRFVEFAGLGPAPFCAGMLSSLGAEVIRVDRADAAGRTPGRMTRGRRSIALDLKSPAAIEACLALLEWADGLLEGFRPGVMERLGLGPDVVLARNPRLVYGRMTGWGQTGPLAAAAGHDINYIALSGALNSIGTAEQPVPPLNVVGDFGGGAMFLGFGLLAAVIHAQRTGTGQVVDCSMVEGSAALLSPMYEAHAERLVGARGSNLLDGGAPFYNPYRCADGKWIAIGSIEPQFYALLLDKAGLKGDVDPAMQNDRATWPSMKARFAALFATRTRAQWCELMEGTDICFAPVLDLDEAIAHPHNTARGSFVQVDGKTLPGPAPRFSVTPGRLGAQPRRIGEDTAAVLRDWEVPASVRASLAGG